MTRKAKSFYEVVGRDLIPCVCSADDLQSAKDLRDKLFATGNYSRVFIKQYVDGGQRYRILRTLTKLK